MAQSEPGVVGRERLTERLCWAVAISLLVTHITMAWMARLPAVTPAANDDALYLLLARSLTSFEYVDNHVVGSPGHAQYPPAYPAALALAGLVFGNSLNVAQGLTILFSAVALLLTFDLARRLAGPLVAVFTLVPLAFNQTLLNYAGRISTEPPYMLFSIATVWVLTVLPPGPRQYLLAGLLAIVAALTRSVGVAIVGAVILLWLFQRRFKPALVLTLVSAITVGGWLYWTTVAPYQFTERSYAAVATTTAAHFSGPLGLVLTRTINFGKVYLAKSFASGLMVPTIEGPVVDNAFWLLVIVGFGGLGFWAMRRRAPAVPLYFLAYCGVLLLYPYKMTRFIMPVEPLVLLAITVGLVTGLRRFGPRTGVVAAGVLALVISTRTVPAAVSFATQLQDCKRSEALVSNACFKEDRLAFFQAARFARERLPRGAAVLTIKEATFYYYTGFRVLHPDLAMQRGKDDVIGFVRGKGIEYVLVTPFVGGAEIVRSLLPACDRIEVLGNFGYRTVLMRFADSSQGSRSACKNLQDITAALREEEEERKNTDASL